MVWTRLPPRASPEGSDWVYVGASRSRMQKGEPSFAAQEVHDDRPGSRLLLRETTIEVPYKCTCITFLTQSAHHLLGDLTLHIFSGVFLKPVRLQVLVQ